jgi:nicotinate-nucleotide adenylyltransferase
MLKLTFMKIAILGGAFDPIHIGHYLVAEQVKEQLHLDEVWFMVCYSYFPEFPDKLQRITSYEERFKMATLYAGKDIVVSDFEEKFNKRSRTIDTLRLLKQHHPQDDFFWIIGSDALPTFKLWNHWEELVRDHNLIVFPRDTDFKTLEKRVKSSFSLKEIPKNIRILEGNLIVSTISSTHVRERVKRKLPITPLVGDVVDKYIVNKQLYLG